MEKLLLILTFVILPQFAQAANQCIDLFKSSKISYDSFSVDTTTMNNLDYLLVQHRRWQQRHQIKYYTKQQLHEFTLQAKKGDPIAIENLMVSNIPLVVQEVSARVSVENPIFPELVSEALMGIYAVIRRYEPNHPNASFLEALKQEVQNVLKTRRKNDEVLKYGTAYYNDIKNHFNPIKNNYENQGKRLTAELLVKEYKNRFDINLSLAKAKQLLLNSKYDTVREEVGGENNLGFSLDSLKSTNDFSQDSLRDIQKIHDFIDQIFIELNNPKYIKIFELYYGLNNNPKLTQAAIANKLGINRTTIQWTLDNKINPLVVKRLGHFKDDMELLENAFATYKISNQRPEAVSSLDLEQEMDKIYEQYLDNKPLIEILKKLRKLETQILQSEQSDRIFEYHYFMAEILLEAKKYDLATIKAQYILDMGKDWSENHENYMMLHYIAGKSAYHMNHLKQAESHLRKSLVVKGATYEAWFYYTKTIEKLNNTNSLSQSFQKYILNMTVLHKLESLDANSLSPKEFDQYKTIEYLTQVELSSALKTLKNIHGVQLIQEKQIAAYTEALNQNDAIGVVNALMPLYKGLNAIPKKKLKKLKLEGPTTKAFHIFMKELAMNLKKINRLKDFEQLIRFLEEL